MFYTLVRSHKVLFFITLCSTLMLSVFSIAAQAPTYITLIDPVAQYGGNSLSPMIVSNQRNSNPAGTCAWKWDGIATGQKAQISISPQSLGFAAGALRIEHLESITYHTYKTRAIGQSADFYINLYYQLNGHGAASIGRIDFETNHALNASAPGGQWNRWSTDVGTNQLTFHDPVTANTDFGFANGPTLDFLTGGVINWANWPTSNSVANIDYRPGVIQRFVFDTSSNTAGLWGNFYGDAIRGQDSGYIDRIEFRFSAAAGGPTHVIIDLECQMPTSPTPSAPSAPILSGSTGTPPSGDPIDCNLLQDNSNGAMSATGTVGNVSDGVITGNSYCRVIAQDGLFIENAAAIGKPEILALGVTQAVDVFGMLPNGHSWVPFSMPAELCLRGTGVVYFADAADLSRAVRVLPSVVRQGYTCTTLTGSGTVALVNS